MNPGVKERVRKFQGASPVWPTVIDSLTLSRMVLFLEAEFRITFRLRDLKPENFASMEAVTALVESKLAQR